MTREVREQEWRRWRWVHAPEFAAFRHGRFIVVELLSKHRVLTTSAAVGGLAEDVTHMVNHQSCEGAAHIERCEAISNDGPDGYHRSVCLELDLAPEKTAVLGTAANMIYAAHEAVSFAGVRVEAIVTAGVEGNACCAGDPAMWVETATGWSGLAETAGTINTIVLIDQPMKAEAQVRALMTVTEAKTAALMELGISSRYSEDLATGTGTDQICIAAPMDPARHAYASAGPHSKLGELLGQAVRRATRQALRWQNGLEPSFTRSLVHALRRFGFSENALKEAMSQRLAESPLRLLQKNLKAVLYEPQAAAAAYAYAAVLDRIRYGVLPKSVARDVLRHQAAILAAALSARHEDWIVFWRTLDVDPDRPLDAIYDAVAAGWAAKWALPD